jgi:hypothetical protein
MSHSMEPYYYSKSDGSSGESAIGPDPEPLKLNPQFETTFLRHTLILSPINTHDIKLSLLYMFPY